MTVRIRYRLEVAISSTNAEEKDLANAVFEMVSDDHDEGGVRKFILAAGAVNTPVDLGNITTGRLLAIRTNARDSTQTPVEITVRRNTTGNEALPIRPMDGTLEGHMLMSTNTLTGLFASNPGAIDMEMTVFVVGD